MRGVRVINPVPGGNAYVTVHRAYSLVLSRRARWNDPITRDAILFKRTPEEIAREQQRRIAEENVPKVWKVKPSAGHFVWQLRKL